MCVFIALNRTAHVYLLGDVLTMNPTFSLPEPFIQFPTVLPSFVTAHGSLFKDDPTYIVHREPENDVLNGCDAAYIRVCVQMTTRYSQSFATPDEWLAFQRSFVYILSYFRDMYPATRTFHLFQLFQSLREIDAVSYMLQAMFTHTAFWNEFTTLCEQECPSIDTLSQGTPRDRRMLTRRLCLRYTIGLRHELTRILAEAKYFWRENYINYHRAMELPLQLRQDRLNQYCCRPLIHCCLNYIKCVEAHVCDNIPCIRRTRVLMHTRKNNVYTNGMRIIYDKLRLTPTYTIPQAVDHALQMLNNAYSDLKVQLE